MAGDDAAAALLCRAFFSDPVFQWALPSDEARRGLTPFFSGMIRWGRKFGTVDHLGPDDAPTAVAIWGSQPAGFIEHLRAGLLWPTLALGPRALSRFLRLGAVLEHWHHRICPEPHRYLYFVGVDPPHQGKGLGAELLRPALIRADQHGLPCYLETATEPNVGFYRRLDFSVSHEGQVHPPAPRLWLLKRPVRSK